MKKQKSTKEVANFFRNHAANAAPLGQDVPTAAPAAVESFAYVTLGGDIFPESYLGESEDTAWESNHYVWFDLEEVPVGGQVFRQTVLGTVWRFTRLEEDKWGVEVGNLEVPEYFPRFGSIRGWAPNSN